ncbi:MAG: helix-turn-helix domain-containing protein [Candidatus Aminicenantes bacterium]|nr:helix-turn-helix domain-containing protein [Candidatus Aminicenantes bacterium]
MNAATIDSWFRTLSTINLVGAAHALVQALLLVFSKRGNRPANRIMALFLLVLALGMANGFINILGWYDRWPFLSILVGSVALTYGPLYYFYIRTMSGREFRWRQPARLGHFVPFLLGLVFWAAFWIFRRQEAVPGILAWCVRTPWLPVTIMAVVQMTAYVTLMIRCLRDYARKIKDSFSSLDGINLRWLKWRLAVFAAICVAGLAVVAVFKLDRRLVNVAGQVGFFLAALNIFATGYRTMFQPQVFFGTGGEGGPGKRYKRSSLTAEKAGLLKTRLLGMMASEKPFLDPAITLPGLAQALDVPLNHLSQVINEQLGRNFFDFINGYRVDAAKQRLSRPDAGQVKMITVAFDCGFNSLATFNRVFKDLTGQPPSRFRTRAVS